MPDAARAAGAGRAPRVAIVGAGITGLTTAYTLARLGADVAVYEAEGRVGGVIASTRTDGRLVEAGPNSVAASPALWELVRELGLAGEVTRAGPAARRRYVVRDGAAHALPGSPLALLRTPLLSAAGKWRLLREPWAAAPPAEEESVAAFVRRRLGPEALARLVEALVTGIYAGDAAQLSARHALPRLVALEREHGSLIGGALRAAWRRRGTAPVPDAPPPGSISFRGGLATLPAALAAALGPRVARDTAVRAVAPRAGGGWRLSAQRHGGAATRVEADAVVLAVPAHALGALELPRDLGEALAPVAAVTHAPVATLTLAFARDEVGHPLDGFGVLVPPAESMTLRGVLFTSSVFPDRCDPDEVLLTCFIGGVLGRDDAAADTATLLPRVLAELRRLLGVRGAPRLVAHSRVAQAIPQYALGHGAVLAAADDAERAWGGLVLAGSWRDGIAVGDCVAGGRAAAARALHAARHAAPSADARRDAGGPPDERRVADAAPAHAPRAARVAVTSTR